ncbi:MAG: type II secretion system F family protein [Phycisphaerales bacterium]|nr:MAG: type II secretion system F family protein [Phycisphaerales bacterium]
MLTELMKTVNIDITSPEILVAILSFVAVAFVGTAILFFVHQRRKKALQARFQSEASAGTVQAELPTESRLLRLIEGIGNFVSHGHASTSLWEQLIRAGYLSRGAPAVYTGMKILLFVFGLAIAAALVIPRDGSILRKTWLISLAGLIPFFIPNLIVVLRERRRREEVRQHLPDVVDLLEICVSSGIGLDMAWNMVADEIHSVSPVLAGAMDLSNFEMHLGTSRTEAMRNMATRTGAEQLSSLAAILVQSERFGTSVAAALREFAASMREERRMTAEENAEKIAVKLIIPMVLFIFPAVLVITVGPAAMNIARMIFFY